MNTSFNQSQSFETRLTDKIVGSINTCSNKLFELFEQLQDWYEKKNELDFQYRDCLNTSPTKRNGQLFLLFILLPVLGIIDYASISQFITYLSVSSGGGLFGSLITLLGWLFFILLELATGWILIYYAKNKPTLKIMAILLAIGLIVLPSYLIYTTYDINPQKTDLLYHKTIALSIVSIIIHAIFFLVVGEVWGGIHYCIYFIKNKLLEAKHPYKAMKTLIEKLQGFYPDFDKCTSEYSPEKCARLLHNRAWYVRYKVTNGTHSRDYDLSDYDPDTSYSGQPKTSQLNGLYHYTVNK